MSIYDIKIKRKESVANGTMAYYFDKPDSFEFRAGQFADYTFTNPPETDAEGNTRGFSFITAPYEDELGFATRLRDTAFKRVLKSMLLGEEGLEVKLDGPYGDFTLHKTSSTPAVFIIGGIGVTPIRSIVKQALYDGSGHQMTLFHANRTSMDAPFESDFQELATRHGNFHYVSVYGEEESDGAEQGRMNADILKKYVGNVQAPIYYLSGPEGMVKAIRQMLVGELAISEDNIRTEEFTGY